MGTPYETNMDGNNNSALEKVRDLLEGMNNSTREGNGSKVLPLDMQFNDGHIVSITVYSVLLVLSAGGNITVLTAILRRKRPFGSLTRIDFLLLHLAIADLMVTLFMMPLEIGWAATVYWRAGDVMCRVMSFFRIFGLFLSGFILVCLAIDRYLAVRYPMQGLSSTKRAKLMVTASWVLSTACSFPQILIFHVEKHPNFPWYTQCVTYNSFPKPEYDLLYQIFGMIMMYALPFILLAVLYGSIALELYKMSHSTSDAFGIQDGLRRTGTENIERAKVKSIQMTFVITAAFLICWTPYYVMCIWYWMDPETAKKVDFRIQKGLFLFACTNSTVNPIVYGVFHMKSIFGRNRMQFRDVTLTQHHTSTTHLRSQVCSKENISFYQQCQLKERDNNMDSIKITNNLGPPSPTIPVPVVLDESISRPCESEKESTPFMMTNGKNGIGGTGKASHHISDLPTDSHQNQKGGGGDGDSFC